MQHPVALGEIIVDMTRAIGHRGPDDEGVLLVGPDQTWSTVALSAPDRVGALDRVPSMGSQVALGHRRLSIIDVSPAGHQPMVSDDGRFWLAYNGELFNYVELRRELEADGVRFRSTSDSEVLLEAWRQWGAASLERFIGMWAFALYDSLERQLVLSRDPFGIKPLYVSRMPGRLAFGSEPRALLEVPWVGRRADAQRVFDYLRYGRSDDGSATFFSAIERFPAGHYAIIHADAPDRYLPVAYWTDGPEVDPTIDMGAASAQLRDLLLESVELHMRADVSVGAALSGGLDSSTLVCLMREVFGTSLDLHTFSFLADDPALTEEPWIDAVVQRTAPIRHVVTPTGDELRADIDTLIGAQGEPILGLSSYAEFRVFRLAQDVGIKVVLDGQGADEMFGGYSPYLGNRLASLIRAGRLPSAARFWRTADASPHARALGRSVGVHAARAVLPAALEPIGRRLMKDGPLPPWMSRVWFERHDINGSARRMPSGRHMLQAALADDRQHMFQWQLRSEDRDAMWHSIENRVPFLTAPLVRFARSLPEQLLIDDSAVPKAVLRHAMRGIVPDLVLDRKEKLGFAPPERAWLEHLAPWVDASLASARGTIGGLVDIEQLSARWRHAGPRERSVDGALWRAVNLARWAERFEVDLDAAADPEAPLEAVR